MVIARFIKTMRTESSSNHDKKTIIEDICNLHVTHQTAGGLFFQYNVSEQASWFGHASKGKGIVRWGAAILFTGSPRPERDRYRAQGPRPPPRRGRPARSDAWPHAGTRNGRAQLCTDGGEGSWNACARPRPRLVSRTGGPTRRTQLPARPVGRPRAPGPPGSWSHGSTGSYVRLIGGKIGWEIVVSTRLDSVWLIINMGVIYMDKLILFLFLNWCRFRMCS